MTTPRMRMLVAGVTGQLGAGVVDVAARLGVELVPLVRRDRPGRLPLDRLLPQYAGAAVDGDVTDPGWGLTDGAVRRLAGTVDAVVNLAGETNWAAPGRRLYETNVLGAVHGRDLAARLQDAGGRRVVYCYASSLFVAGGMIGSVPEAPLPVDRHRTAYEHSKWLAEQELCRSSRPGEPDVLVARICALLGDERTGRTLRRNSLYLLAERWPDIPLRVLPAMPRARVDALPRDVAADALLRALHGMSSGPAGAGTVIVHVAAGERAPTLRSLLEAARAQSPYRFARWVRVVPAPVELVVGLSQNLERFVDLSEAWRNSVIGLRYVGLERLYERANLARLLDGTRLDGTLLDGTLPRPSVELLARLLFDLPEATTSRPVTDPGLSRFVS